MSKKSPSPLPPRVSATPRESEKEDGNPTSVPKLRFPEFRDELAWTVSALGNLATFAAGGTPSKDAPEYWNGHIPWISASSMYDTNLCDSKHKVTSEAIGNGTRIAKAGSLLILTRGSMLYNRVPMGIASIDVAFNQDVRALIVDSLVDTAFLMKQLISQESRIAIHDTGIGAGKIDTDDLRRFLVAIPSLPEQRKIAACLSTLDELIGAQDRKVDALQTHKKGLMQQLFPREGETQPRLRFPEFKKDGVWKRRKIGEMLMETQRPIALSDTTEYRLVTVKRRYGGLVLREVLNGRQILVKCQFIVRSGDFLISKRQIVHNACGLVTQELDGAIVSNEYSVLTPMPECSIEFFSWFSMQRIVSKSFMDCSVGIVIEKMLFKLPAWLKQEFLFPSFQEQQRIASCLSSLDDLINAQTQKLEALKTHKRGLMQQLFPSPEDT